MRKKQILFVDDRIPNPGLWAGYPRAYKILSALADNGYQITFYPFIVSAESGEDERAFLPADTLYLGALSPHDVRGFLARQPRPFDWVWVSRPHNMRRLLEGIPDRAVWRMLIPNLIYDAEAVFVLREKVRATVLRLPFDEAKIEQEKNLVGRAQRIVTVSAQEAAFFSQAGVPVEVLAHSVDVTPTPRSFEERYGFVFIGPIINDQTPNADALRYLLNEVWPKIRAALPNATLQVIGANDLLSVFQSLCAGGVEFLGQISDQALFECADHARVHIVPTRFSAGVPLKAMTLAALGLPMVTTLMIQEQLGWTRGELVAADWQNAAQFGEACVRLHEDPALWMSVREKSLAAVRQLADPAKFRADLGKITG